MIYVFIFLNLLIPCSNNYQSNDLVYDLRLDCNSSNPFCNESNPLFSEFVCDWICRVYHNTVINKDSDTQYYLSIDAEEALDLYNEFINYFETGNFEYEGMQSGIYGIDFYLLNNYFDYTLNYLNEDEWWDSNNNGIFDIGFTYAENYKKGWGTFSLNDNSINDNIAIHINHPYNDLNSDFISGYIFDNEILRPKWMLMAGAHRYAKVDVLNINSACYSSGTNYGADTARNIGIDASTCNEISYTTPFQVYHEALSDYIFNLYSLSIHGFIELNEDALLDAYSGTPTFIISNGNSSLNNGCIPPDLITSTIYHYLNDYFSGTGNYFNEIDETILDQYDLECSNVLNFSTDVAVIVQQEIPCENQPITCASSSYSPFGELGATQNPQGRYNNGYYDPNINVGIDSANNDDTWAQIEIHGCIRDQIQLYEKASSIISMAINDCNNGNCVDCSVEAPCSSTEGNGVDYNLYTYDCVLLDLGNLNNDSFLNIFDIVILVEYVSDSYYNAYGDMNLDDTLNISDIIILVNIILDN